MRRPIDSRNELCNLNSLTGKLDAKEILVIEGLGQRQPLPALRPAYEWLLMQVFGKWWNDRSWPVSETRRADLNVRSRGGAAVHRREAKPYPTHSGHSGQSCPPSPSAPLQTLGSHRRTLDRTSSDRSPRRGRRPSMETKLPGSPRMTIGPKHLGKEGHCLQSSPRRPTRSKG
jgi:hypothetical protein